MYEVVIDEAEPSDANTTSAGVVMVGNNILKAENNCTKQRINRIVLYADALQASHGKSMTSLMRDVGDVMDPEVAIEAKAKGHILHRLSVGRMKHVGVAHTWLQDAVR